MALHASAHAHGLTAQEPAGRLALNKAICAAMPGAKSKTEAAVPGLFAALQTCDWPSAAHGLVSEDLQARQPPGHCAGGPPAHPHWQPAASHAALTSAAACRGCNPPLCIVADLSQEAEEGNLACLLDLAHCSAPR